MANCLEANFDIMHACILNDKHAKYLAYLNVWANGIDNRTP